MHATTKKCPRFSSTPLLYVIQYCRKGLFEDNRKHIVMSLLSAPVTAKGWKKPIFIYWKIKLLLLNCHATYFDLLLYIFLLILLSHLWLWSSHVLETHKTACCPILQDFFFVLPFFLSWDNKLLSSSASFGWEEKEWKHPWNLIIDWRPYIIAWNISQHILLFMSHT